MSRKETQLKLGLMPVKSIITEINTVESQYKFSAELFNNGSVKIYKHDQIIELTKTELDLLENFRVLRSQ